MELEHKSHSNVTPKIKNNTKVSKPKKKKITIEDFPISDEVLEQANQLGSKKPKSKPKREKIKPPFFPNLGNLHEKGKYNHFMSVEEPNKAVNEATERQKGNKPIILPEIPDSSIPPAPNFKIPNWLFALLLIFALSMLGLGLSAFTKSPIPFWLLLGFSIIYPIEKWFRKATLNKPAGKLYRLILNLALLSTLGLLIWSGFQLVEKQLATTPFISSGVFLAELVFFIWIWRKVAKNNWRWPSMKLTIFVLVCMAVIFTFAGVPPLSTYKDTLIAKWEDYQTEQVAQQAEQEAEIEAGEQRQQVEQERIEEERLKAEQEAEAQRIEEERIAQEQVELARREAEAEKERLVSNEHYETLFNEYRQSYGLSVLIFTVDLNERASLRLPELELDYSHNSLGNYNLHLAENIMWISFGGLSNVVAFNSWKGSSGHNASMLGTSYKYTGYAIGGNYAVQLFSAYPTVNGEPQLPSGWYWP